MKISPVTSLARFAILGAIGLLLGYLAIAALPGTFTQPHQVPSAPETNLPYDVSLATAVRNPNSAGAPNKPQAPAANVIQGGGFEDGSPNPYWEEFSTLFGTPLCTQALCGGPAPHGGTWHAWFGGAGPSAAESGYLSQTVTINSGPATLSFYLLIGVASGGTGDFTVTVDNTVVFNATEADAASYPTYTLVSVNVSAFADNGQHVVKFAESDPADAGNINFFVDDVALDTGSLATPTATATTAGGPTPTPTATSLSSSRLYMPVLRKDFVPSATPLPTPTATATPPHWAGITSRSQPMSFDVSGNGAQWSNFKLRTDFSAPSCGSSGTIEVTIPGPGNITANQFSYTGSTYAFTGQFLSASTASGTYAFTNYQIIIPLPGPPFICYYYLTQNGTWTANGP